MKVGVNWHLKFREQIKQLKTEIEKTKIQRDIALRKLNKKDIKNEKK